MPSVSVIMPVRDGDRHLEEALNSILGQTLRDIEVLVIDDGSRDRTPALLAGQASRDPRLRVLRQDRQGIVKALQTGLAAAESDLVARLDSDDIAEPDRLERQVGVLERHPEIAVVGTACTLIDGRGSVIGAMHHPVSVGEVRHRLMQACCVSHPSVMMRRSPVLDLGGYRSAFLLGEDYDLWLRLSERHDIVNLDERLIRYRIHAGQSTWWSHEQRILTELAALACARLRRAGRLEPALPAAAVDRDFLVACGLSRPEIRREVAMRAVAAAETGLQHGLWRHAAAAARLGLRERGFGYRWTGGAVRRIGRAAISRVRAVRSAQRSRTSDPRPRPM